jgi:hypothetical protein
MDVADNINQLYEEILRVIEQLHVNQILVHKLVI